MQFVEVGVDALHVAPPRVLLPRGRRFAGLRSIHDTVAGLRAESGVPVAAVVLPEQFAPEPETIGGVRSLDRRVVVDGRDLLVDEEVRSLLAIRDTPTVILRATGGLNGAPPPLIPTEAISEYDHHLWQTIEGTNHYTILLGPTGAEAVAESIRNVTSPGSRL